MNKQMEMGKTMFEVMKMRKSNTGKNKNNNARQERNRDNGTNETYHE